MSTDERERLLAIAREWRDTAAEWERHRLSGYVTLMRGVPKPPESRRASIHNWENWLKGCAKQVEDALAPPPGDATPPCPTCNGTGHTGTGPYLRPCVTCFENVALAPGDAGPATPTAPTWTDEELWEAFDAATDAFAEARLSTTSTADDAAIAAMRARLTRRG